MLKPLKKKKKKIQKKKNKKNKPTNDIVNLLGVNNGFGGSA